MTVVQHTKRTKAPALRQGFYFARKPLAVCRAVVIVLSAVILVSCASTRRAPQAYAPVDYIPATFDWQPITDYADYAFFENEARTVRYHCVKIDLTAPQLQLVAYPQTAGAFKGKTTRAFAKEAGAQIAINATPFAGRLFKKRTVGVYIADGTLFSAPVARYDALSFSRTKNGWQAHVVTAQESSQLASADYAFGGFWVIVRDGVTQPFAHTSYDARTAAGINAKSTTLYLLVVEENAGLSFQQCADIFLALGAQNAIQFDGGSSSDLIINGKSVFLHNVHRKVGVSFGFTDGK